MAKSHRNNLGNDDILSRYVESGTFDLAAPLYRRVRPSCTRIRGTTSAPAVNAIKCSYRSHVSHITPDATCKTCTRIEQRLLHEHAGYSKLDGRFQ